MTIPETILSLQPPTSQHPQIHQSWPNGSSLQCDTAGSWELVSSSGSQQGIKVTYQQKNTSNIPALSLFLPSRLRKSPFFKFDEFGEGPPPPYRELHADHGWKVFAGCCPPAENSSTSSGWKIWTQRKWEIQDMCQGQSTPTMGM